MFWNRKKKDISIKTENEENNEFSQSWAAGCSYREYVDYLVKTREKYDLDCDEANLKPAYYILLLNISTFGKALNREVMNKMLSVFMGIGGWQVPPQYTRKTPFSEMVNDYQKIYDSCKKNTEAQNVENYLLEIEKLTYGKVKDSFSKFSSYVVNEYLPTFKKTYFSCIINDRYSSWLKNNKHTTCETDETKKLDISFIGREVSHPLLGNGFISNISIPGGIQVEFPESGCSHHFFLDSAFSKEELKLNPDKITEAEFFTLPSGKRIYKNDVLIDEKYGLSINIVKILPELSSFAFSSNDSTVYLAKFDSNALKGYKNSRESLAKASSASIQNIQASGSDDSVVEENVYCYKCGSKLRPGAIFCSKCGTKVSN